MRRRDRAAPCLPPPIIGGDSLTTCRVAASRQGGLCKKSPLASFPTNCRCDYSNSCARRAPRRPRFNTGICLSRHFSCTFGVTIRTRSKAMEVSFTPDVQAKLDKLAIDTGRAPGELVEDVIAGYFDELTQTREMLNSRYDDLKSGRVKPIDGEEFFDGLRRREEDLLTKQSPQ